LKEVEIIAANLNENKNFSKEEKNKKVCAYCRVSTDNEDQQTSYKSQIEHYSEQIKNTPNCKFVGIYADEGISGTQIKNRIEFQRMIDDALNGKIDIIIAKSISRFARNTMDTLKYCRMLREHNVDVYFEKENIHTLEMDSEMFLTLYSAFAQAESESTSMNVKLGVRAKMKRGEIINGSTCYGFDWNKETKELEINEEQAEIVRKVFNWYIDGLGTRKIARKLNDLGIPSCKGTKWCQSAIRRIISQEKYTGDLLQQKYYVTDPLTHKEVTNKGEKEKYYIKDHHKPIVSREIWNKANEIAKSRFQKFVDTDRPYIGQYKALYSFSNKIECCSCHQTFVRRTGNKKKDGTQNIYWACTSRQEKTSLCRNSRFLRDNVLEEIFIQIYNSIVSNKHKTKDKLLNAIKDVVNNTDYKVKIGKLNSEKIELEKRLSNLIDMKLDDYANKSVYTTKENEINLKITKIVNQIAEYRSLEQENKQISSKLSEIEKVLNVPKILKEFDRETFDNIVDKIIVGEVDENGNENFNVIRVILKIGTEYAYDLGTSKITNKTVSFDSNERTYSSRINYNKKPYVGMTNFKGDYVTVDDVKIAKNYLSEIELQRLNLLVSQFLDYAELQALEQRTMKMQDWVEELDNQILLNRRKILEGNGKISHEEAIKKAEEEEEEEFKIYRQREMKELQNDFDLLMNSLPNNKGGENNE